MASSSSAGDIDSTAQLSAAQQLLEKHNVGHQVTVEDVPDEDLKHDTATVAAPAGDDAAAPSWVPPISTKAAGKQKAEEKPVALDTQSHELFPELGGPKKVNAHVAPIWNAKASANANGKANGASPTNGTPRTSTPSSPGAATPASSSPRGAPALAIPNRNVETVTLDTHDILPRTALKRPLADTIKEINRKSRANINMVPPAGGRVRFDATGPRDAALHALKDLIEQIGVKSTVKVPIPQSTRAHIIGKQGSTIKAIQEQTGARIQLPKVEDSPPYPVDDDDDATIDVTVEGNPFSRAAARDAILKIAGERTANVNTKLRGIPSEFYPFIADPRSGLLSNLEGNGIQVRVPPHQPWSAQPPAVPAPGQAPVFAPAPNDSHIQLAGDRAAVQRARTEIERRVEELRQQLQLQQTAIPKNLQQFIIGDKGTPMENFFNETGCAIVLPTDEDDDMVTIVGPAGQLRAGVDRANDLAQTMQCTNCDISRFHRQAPGGAAAHARNVTRYLRERQEIDRLEREYQSHIITPFSSDGALPWELYSRERKNTFEAQTEIKGIVMSHPPSRIGTIEVDPFFYQYLRGEINPRIRQEHGVYLVVPKDSERNAPILLVYEGPSEEPSAPYRIPQAQPSAEDIRLFKKGIEDAQRHIRDLISKQDEITSTSIDVPQKYHEKLRKFIKREQEGRSPNEPPVRVSSMGSIVTMRGPKSSVESLVQKTNEFIEQEKQDEKERGFILSFEFPQKYVNHLIGKGGSNIREIRDKFDVEIQVENGVVELKGPKAKSEAAKAHILALGRQLADETTHIVKIEPKFHRELIGAQGGTINRLQDRYKVLIFFPRSPKSARDDESIADAVSEAGKGRRQQAPDEVIIRGPKKGADEARDEILTLYQYLKDNSFTATVTVQQKQLPYLIGQGGSAMESLRQETGAKVDIPNNRDSPEAMVEIQIKGTKAQVAAAKKILEEKKAVLDDTVIRTIEVDKKYHKALIGAGGSHLRELVVKAGGSDDRRELSRTIQFPKQDSEENVIKVEGRKSVVDKIVSQIEEFVAQRQSEATEQVDVPVEKHRALIGRGGDVKRQMESQFSVSIDIPRQGSGETAVKIVGQPANVEKAKEHILSLIKEQHGETVQVPRSLHHAVANNGQFFRRMRSDHHVTIDHAGHTVPARPAAASANSRANGSGGALPLITDDADTAAEAHSWNVVENTSAEEGEIPWVLRGTPEGVEKAKKALEAAIEQAKKINVTGYLVLPDPRTYRHVIGQGGRKIDSIRKQSGCRINVPHGKSSDEAIEVLGTREGVEKAKELILAAVRDGIKSRE